MGSSVVSQIVIVAALVRFGFRELKERRVRLDRIFIGPAIFGFIALSSIGAAAFVRPGDAVALAALATIGALIGGAAGYGTAHYTTIRVAPEPRVVFTKGSWVTVAIWCGALALRLVGRIEGARAVSPLVANAALFTLLAALIGVVRYRIFVKSQLAIARGTTAEITAV